MDDNEKAIRAGCNAYLTKPVLEEDLQPITKILEVDYPRGKAKGIIRLKGIF